jgi:DNA-binding CsgD family transcriptional regulator
MSEVAIRLVKASIDLMRARGGVVSPSAFEGLSFSEADLFSWSKRVPWDDYALLAERLQSQGSSLEHAERSAGQLGLVMPEIGALAGALINPLHVYRFMFRALPAMMVPVLRTTYREIDERRVYFEIEIPPTHRACLPFIHGLRGWVRAAPTYLGLPPAEVEATIEPRRGRYHILLPQSQTLLARWRRSRRRDARGGVPLDSTEVFDALRAAHTNVDDLSHRMQRMKRLMERVSEDSALDVRAADVTGLCTDELGCTLAELWVHNETGLVLASQRGTRSLQTEDHPLRIGSVEVGRLRVAGAPRPALLVELLPVMALVVERARATAAPGSPEQKPQERYASVKEEWGLSPRQVEVLGWIIRGLSNKEIAAELGCSERTVEAHVGALLQRTACDSRSRLVSKYWSGG